MIDTRPITSAQDLMRLLGLALETIMRLRDENERLKDELARKERRSAGA